MAVPTEPPLSGVLQRLFSRSDDPDDAPALNKLGAAPTALSVEQIERDMKARQALGMKNYCGQADTGRERRQGNVPADAEISSDTVGSELGRIEENRKNPRTVDTGELNTEADRREQNRKDRCSYGSLTTPTSGGNLATPPGSLATPSYGSLATPSYGSLATPSYGSLATPTGYGNAAAPGSGGNLATPPGNAPAPSYGNLATPTIYGNGSAPSGDGNLVTPPAGGQQQQQQGGKRRSVGQRLSSTPKTTATPPLAAAAETRRGDTSEAHPLTRATGGNNLTTMPSLLKPTDLQDNRSSVDYYSTECSISSPALPIDNEPVLLPPSELMSPSFLSTAPLVGTPTGRHWNDCSTNVDALLNGSLSPATAIHNGCPSSSDTAGGFVMMTENLSSQSRSGPLCPLTKDQMLQAMLYLLKNDEGFVHKLHTAYVDSLNDTLFADRSRGHHTPW